MKVLMATMQLDIGGAETHIVELSKALKKRGVDVCVASKGGAYEAELEEAGIPHYYVPLNSRNINSMKKSYKILERLIKTQDFDVVHAHARIPAFILGRLQKKLKFRFVTTAHWVFSTKFPLNKLTDWGQRSLAVSDDIKKYLIDNYGIDGDNIRVTINGIDTDKFSGAVDYSDIAKEFSFGENKTRIVYVSRMDADRSYAAHKLIEIAPELFKKINNLEIVIVGGGNDYENISKEAESANEKCGTRFVITTGARIDINKFVASADIFVGVSRAALEAMAAQKPAIIAGNEGYIGIFDEDKLKISIDTNFCCRGCRETTADELKRDILSLLENKDVEKLEKLGRYAGETVKKYYSVETMADDAMKMYVSIIKGSKINSVSEEEIKNIDALLNNSYKGKKILISGYYGYHNSGDDSILAGIVRELKKLCPGVEITVLSKNPAETEKHYGVRSAGRFDIFGIIGALKSADLLISGGGSLLQDMTSSKSLLYYLSIIKLAELFGVKTYIYANGIGPVNKPQNRKKVKKILNRADMITLREKSSADELKALGVDAGYEITADPVFAISPEDEKSTGDYLEKKGLNRGENYFVVSVRPWLKTKEDFAEQTALFCRKIYDAEGLIPVILAMQPAKDGALSEEICKAAGIRCILINESLGCERILGILRGASFAAAMRLHTLIYAAKTGTPSIGISYDPKVSAMLEYTNQDFNIDIEKVNSDTLFEYAEKILKNKEEISSALKERADCLAALAEKNAEIAAKLLK